MEYDSQPQYAQTPRAGLPSRRARSHGPSCGPPPALNEDQGFPSRHAMTILMYLITVSNEQVQLAGQGPNRGRLAFSVLFLGGNPAEVSRDPVFNRKNFRRMEAKDGWFTGKVMGPITPALKAARAKLVGPREFRAADENDRFLRPLAGRGFQVWELPKRSARSGKLRRNWRLGARLGPYASRAYSRLVWDLDATPPGIRKAGFREVTEVLCSPGHVGYPRVSLRTPICAFLSWRTGRRRRCLVDAVGRDAP